MVAEAVRDALQRQLGIAVESLEKTRGGDINDAWRAETDRGPVFIKTSPQAQAGMFTDEAAGLEWLAEPGGVPVPAVVGVCDGEQQPRLLALEWIEPGTLGPAGEEELGRGLAKIHAAGAPAFGATPLRGGGYGASPMRFNELSLPNTPRATWAEFYAENRILPLLRSSRDRGGLTADEQALIERVVERLPQLAGPPEPPARTHGDLWSGNLLTDRDGRAHLIDPVAHGGHREVDLALLTVFGGPSERCFSAYDEVFPRAAGHAEREQLWQLAMLLLHVHLFGAGWAARTTALAERYV